MNGSSCADAVVCLLQAVTTKAKENNMVQAICFITLCFCPIEIAIPKLIVVIGINSVHDLVQRGVVLDVFDTSPVGFAVDKEHGVLAA
jgi:hypothetical protein